MSREQRLAAAEAFWRDDESADIRVQQNEAAAAVAKRLNFRLKTVQALPIDKRAHQLAQLSEVSDAVATRALIAYHFSRQRPLMAAFLEALGIAHDNGLITDEDIQPPDRARLEAAVEAVNQTHPREDVRLYLRTLAALDGETWAAADRLAE
jgi:hypothetical protein